MPLSAAVESTRASHAIDEAIRAIPAGWFRPSPAVYWTDFLTSTVVGWTAFLLAVRATTWHRAALLLIVVFALYRAVLFVHEITHRARRDVRGFTLVWNALVGVPLLIPSFLYESVHTDHHRQRCYGTEADPEYVPFGRRPLALIIGYVLVSLLSPLAFMIRFGLLAPVSWAVPRLRRPITERCSALVINHRYVRHAPIERAGRVQEVAAFAVFWTSVGLYVVGVMPGAALVCWFVATAAASGINAVRTLAAHRYDHDSGELSMTEQLLDSCTIPPTGRLLACVVDAGRALVAPAGLRYHALHHWVPSIPYHNLGRAHRLLVATLRSDAAYRATVERGLAPALRDLLRRSRTQSRG